MVADFGDSIKPYLKSFYGAALDYPNFDSAGMDEDYRKMDIEAVLAKDNSKEISGEPTEALDYGTVENPNTADCFCGIYKGKGSKEGDRSQNPQVIGHCRYRRIKEFRLSFGLFD